MDIIKDNYMDFMDQVKKKKSLDLKKKKKINNNNPPWSLLSIGNNTVLDSTKPEFMIPEI